MAEKNTIRLHRVMATKPEKVYRAFTEPDAMAKNHAASNNAKDNL